MRDLGWWEGKRREAGVPVGPQGEARGQRGDSSVGAAEAHSPDELGLESQGFRFPPSHQVHVGGRYVSRLIVDTGDTAVNRTYISVPLRSSQPSEGVRNCIKMAAVLVANSRMQMFIAAFMRDTQKVRQPECSLTDQWINARGPPAQWNIIWPLKSVKY